MVAMADIMAFGREIARRYRPEKIILFGSHAYGRPRADSDVDVMVIMPYRGSEMDRAVDMLVKTRPAFSVDLLLYRPVDAQRRYREYDPIIREAFDKGKVLYEQNGKRVAGQGRRRLRQRSRLVAQRDQRQLRRRVLSRAAVH